MINMNKLIRLMPCMYFTNLVFGRSGSGFLMYKYSANCLSTPIKKLHRKDTVSYKEEFLKNYGAGLRRILSCFFTTPPLKLKLSGEF